jgi:hypothetical protein
VLGLDVLSMIEVLKVPGLLFVAKELCCLKLGQRDLETYRGCPPGPFWTAPEQVEEIVPWCLLRCYFSVELV